jgi:hypothetical protein
MTSQQCLNHWLRRFGPSYYISLVYRARISFATIIEGRGRDGQSVRSKVASAASPNPFQHGRNPAGCGALTPDTVHKGEGPGPNGAKLRGVWDVVRLLLWPERAREVRLRVRTNNRVEVPIGQKHWSVRSGRQLRRREAGWRAA